MDAVKQARSLPEDPADCVFCVSPLAMLESSCCAAPPRPPCVPCRQVVPPSVPPDPAHLQAAVCGVGEML